MFCTLIFCLLVLVLFGGLFLGILSVHSLIIGTVLVSFPYLGDSQIITRTQFVCLNHSVLIPTCIFKFKVKETREKQQSIKLQVPQKHENLRIRAGLCSMHSYFDPSGNIFYANLLCSKKLKICTSEKGGRARGEDCKE